MRNSSARTTAVVLFVLALTTSAIPAQSQTLTIQGDHFAVNGVPKFLLFASYFDAMKRSNSNGSNTGDLDTDFQFFVDNHFDGVRIFPNWQSYQSFAPNCTTTGYDTSRLLFNDDAEYSTSAGLGHTGTALLRSGQWAVFTRVLDRALAKGLLVDVSFTRDVFNGGGAGLSRTNYENQLGIVITALTNAYPNVLIDVQNEWPKNEPVSSTNSTADATYVGGLVSTLRSTDPNRIITASMDNSRGVNQSNAGTFALNIGEAVVAYHDARDPGWETSVTSVMSDLKSAIGAPALPIYLQEPMPISAIPGCSQTVDTTGAHFGTAAATARQNGAAAWTFHTRLTFDMSSATYVSKITSSGSCSIAECTTLTGLQASAASQPWVFGFTDDPIQAPSTTGAAATTTIKTAHVMELRVRLDALLAHFSMSPVSWTDSPLTPGTTPVKASHIYELRNAACNTYTHLSLSQPGFCSTLTPSGTIYGSDIANLRTAILALETHW